jgi:hypothetical protein
MYRIVFSLCLSLLLAVGVSAQDLSDERGTVLQTLQRIVDARAGSDTLTLTALLAPSYIETSSDGIVYTKPEVLKRFDNKTELADHKLEMSIGTPVVYFAGNAATVTWVLDFLGELGSQTFNARYRITSVFVKERANWTCIAYHESILARDPKPSFSNFNFLEKYVGKYEAAPGLIVTLVRKGDRLVAETSAPVTSTELFPETETTFFTKGAAGRHTFGFDEQGRVTYLSFHSPAGPVMRLKRIN